MSDQLSKEIQAFEAMEPELLKHHMGKFVVIKGGALAGAYDTFDTAAKEAVKKFGSEVFLIRQVGKKPTMNMPASVAFRPVHATH